MSLFKTTMRDHQIAWRGKYLPKIKGNGNQNGGAHAHVLPYEHRFANFWDPISRENAESIRNYLLPRRKSHHSGIHNLLSSWVLCANLYFPFRDSAGREVLAGFLCDKVSSRINSVTEVELEYQHADKALQPAALLGEKDGSQGAGQTSPDLAFHVDTGSGPGIVLVECKFVEHSFYPCSGRATRVRNGMPNPEPSRCKNAGAVLNAPETQCHLTVWERLYWKQLQHVIVRDDFVRLKACPAAFGGFQLLRQQALAEGIARSNTFALVMSVVALDPRNTELIRCMARSTGIQDFRTDWGKLFRGQTQFATFTHQTWVQWVRDHNQTGRWTDWLNYVANRYGL